MKTCEINIAKPRSNLGGLCVTHFGTPGCFTQGTGTRATPPNPQPGRVRQVGIVAAPRHFLEGHWTLLSGSGSPDPARGRTPQLEQLAGQVSLFPSVSPFRSFVVFHSVTARPDRLDFATIALSGPAASTVSRVVVCRMSLFCLHRRPTCFARSQTRPLLIEASRAYGRGCLAGVAAHGRAD